MSLGTKYRKEKERILASYSYVDIAEGTGVVKYDGFNPGLSGSAIFSLTTSSIASDDIETTGTSWTFNLTAFNLPKVVKGTAIVRFSASQVGASGSTQFWNVILQKVNLDSTVTNIGSSETDIVTGGAGTTVKHNWTVTISLTETNFKKGENLRLVLNSANQAGNTYYLGHDPINRSGTNLNDPTTYPTTLEVLIPFKIDL